jgi:glycosyltransferase involved in cell wall biosynthesis
VTEPKVTPEVTVVLPTHDRRLFLAQTLASVLWQQAVGLEVVVVDDGSSTNPDEVVDFFHDRRVRLLHHAAAQGVSVARNAGAAVAQTKWLAFVDDDDVWAPDKLSKQLRAAQNAGASWCCAGAVRVDEGLHVISEYRILPPQALTRELRRWNCVPGGGSGVLLDRSMIAEKEPIFDPSLKHFADWELWIRLARKGLPTVVDEPLVGYRIHRKNKALETGGMLDDVRFIQRRHGIHPDWGAINHYLAWLHLRTGRRGPALTHFATAAVQGQMRSVLRSGYTVATSRLRWATKRRPRELGTPPRINDVEKWLVELRERSNLISPTGA